MKLSARAQALSADAAEAQGAFFRLHRIQLSLILIAAAVGVIPLGFNGVLNWAALVAAALFGASILVRVLLMNFRDEERWYLSRRNAEAAKSLCFQFAFGARGFERDVDEPTARRRLTQECAKLGDPITRPGREPVQSFGEASEDMISRRRLPMAEAREQYLHERISRQEAWFEDRAYRNRTMARRFVVVMVTAEVLGMIFGILAAVGLAPEGILGLMSAVAAAAIAWSQLRQHSLLERRTRRRRAPSGGWARSWRCWRMPTGPTS